MALYEDLKVDQGADAKFKISMYDENGSTRDLTDYICLLYTSPSPRDKRQSRMPSSA